ncbi:hypothetical protein LguiA_032478 [Lonicera macranthoides]
MGKRLDALLGRRLKTSKLKPTVDLAVSRLAVLNKQRQARLSVARSDVIQLLNLGHHEPALLRVEQVIKEQNLLDVFSMIEGYCHLLIEMVNLIEQAKVCPDELKEAISSLLYTSTRCGELPELQEIRAIFTSRFGKEFAASAIELWNNCGVNPKIIQKLSTKQPSLDTRLKVLQEIASTNGIILQIDQTSQVITAPKADPKEDNSPILIEEIEEVDGFSNSMKGRRKYRDVADAAQAAFESAAYAAAAARAAVELSRSESLDSDDQNSPRSRPRTGTREHVKSKFQNYHSESEKEEIYIESKAEGSKYNKNAVEFKRSESNSSSDYETNEGRSISSRR